MFEEGDIVQIVATEDDVLSKYIAGTYATIVYATIKRQEERYRIKFIPPFVFNKGAEEVLNYEKGVANWYEKNLRLVEKYDKRFPDISESDIMSLIGGD